jgi:hypothetical protein
MMRLLGSIYMCPQLLLLLPQRRLLLPLHSPATKDHHDRFISRLLPISGTAGRLLVLLPLVRSKLLAPLTPFRNGCHSLCVVRLCLFTWTEDVVL